MKLVKFKVKSQDQRDQVRAGVWLNDHIIPLANQSGPLESLEEILDAQQPRQLAESLQVDRSGIAFENVQLVAPLDVQEVWAAGVTYKRSQTARMEESEAAASCYDRVYRSPRPELFMKATSHRVSGPGAPLRIRVDSQWNVPEPELTLVVNRSLRLVGFTIGNDMSSRDIEGDNPLYLPQAKVYNQCCGLGPCITLVDAMPVRDQIGIRLEILRAGQEIFRGSTSVAAMAR
jgi:2-dehydro-3-deoxy-D-arabinonate dehydratase